VRLFCSLAPFVSFGNLLFIILSRCWVVVCVSAPTARVYARKSIQQENQEREKGGAGGGRRARFSPASVPAGMARTATTPPRRRRRRHWSHRRSPRRSQPARRHATEGADTFVKARPMHQENTRDDELPSKKRKAPRVGN
jgi:hypothetical protein